MAHHCQQCGKSYAWKNCLARHARQKHSGQVIETDHIQRDASIKEPVQHNGAYYGPLPRRDSSSFSFKHPFTMMIAAPTGGGKTCFVKKLLEDRLKWIEPSPERILWLYGQWQPLYEKMQLTIPGIEFVKGIPSNIAEDSFLDPRRRNLMVIDDLMSEATKDTRISDLFTRGSHHRNLSVLCLLQNLYYQGKENRTMSLNSHYLVLFKNPRDQQQVMALARQMYPGNAKHFLKEFKKATHEPFNYMVLD